MGRSWKIWLHPKRTRREMEQMEESLVTQSDEMSALLTRMSELTAEYSNLQHAYENEKLKSKKLDDSVMTLTSELLKTRSMLDSKQRDLLMYADQSEQIETFMKKLNEVEQLKHHYEQRINRLRAKVIELQTGNAQVSIMHFDNSNQTPKESNSYPQDLNGDWLQPLPE